MTHASYLRLGIQHHAYQQRSPPFTLKSGRVSQHYLDLRPVMLHAAMRQSAAKLVCAWLELFTPNVQAVAGVVVGACALTTEVSTQLQLPAVFVRPEPKAHGTGQRIDVGYGLPPGDPPRIVLLEDVWTTGGSALSAKQALIDEGFTVQAILALVDRHEPDTVRPDYAFFSLSEFTNQ